MALPKKEKEKIVKKFAQGKLDTGSPEVQIALLDAEVNKLKKHLDEHKGDTAAKRGLLTKIAKRRRLLRYLDSRGEGRYEKLIKVLKLRK
ncbi:30S ribosomal protein S15 [Candidatus Shapirobacteria bacterium]|nr:30S ribosomal protein S15 [Candidatus Shapirobacteria bacterium]